MSFTSALTGGLIADAPDYGKMAVQSEAKRQGIIKLGLQQINALYGGGSAPFYTLANVNGAKFDPKSTYYTQGKKGAFQPYWVPKGTQPKGYVEQSVIGKVLGYLGAAFGVKTLGLDNLFGSDVSPRQIAAKKFRRGLLFNAPNVQTFTGYTDPFFEARQKAYLDYALPQVADQYRQANRALTYSMANRGVQQSTMARQANSELSRTSGEAQQRVADTAVDQANQLRRDVEAARQESIRQLYQSADPAQAMQAAINTASSFERPSTFAPVANMFGNALAQYYTNRNNQALAAAYPGFAGASPNYLAPLTQG